MGKGYEYPELLPVKSEEKILGTVGYTLVILSMTITTSIFFLGWLSKILKLSLVETIVAAILGNSVVAIIMYLNGWVGVKYGIPFPIQLKYTFGYRGSIIPLIIRVVISIFWYGVGGFIAAWAITEMAMLVVGVPVNIILSIGLKYTPLTFILYLIFVWFVGYKKMEGIKWLDTIAGPLLLAFFLWFVLYLGSLKGLPGNWEQVYNSRGVGWLSRNFFLMVAVQTAWWGTIALNVSDICRYVYSEKSLVVGHIFGLVIPQVIGTYLGYVATVLTGGVHSPIDIITKYTPTPLLGVFGLIFATLATGSTNVTGDVIAATNGIIRVAKTSWTKSLTIATFFAWLVIGPYAIFYWKKALDVANYLLLFNWYYSMWLGPIAGVMVVDFWVLRRKKIIISELYNPNGIYKYSNGINLIGLGAFIAGVVGEYIISAIHGNIKWYNFIPVPGVELAWYYGFVISAIVTLVAGYIARNYVLPELITVKNISKK